MIRFTLFQPHKISGPQQWIPPLRLPSKVDWRIDAKGKRWYRAWTMRTFTFSSQEGSTRGRTRLTWEPGCHMRRKWRRSSRACRTSLICERLGA